MATVKTWLIASRPKTLLVAVAPVLLGSAMAYADSSFHLLAAALALCGAVLIQVGTNLYNDLGDFTHGADTADRIGPTRVTASGLASPREVRNATIGAFTGAVVAGLYLIWRGGWPVLAIGVASIASGVAYTFGRRSLAYTGMADLFVLTFFGPVAVAGTFYVQALAVNTEVVLAGVGPGLIATAILVVNNVRDIETDRAAGKQTLVVRFGRKFGIAFYAFCLLGALGIPALMFAALSTPALTMLVLVLAPLALAAISILARSSEGARLNALLARTGGFLFVYSVLFSAGWIAG